MPYHITVGGFVKGGLLPINFNRNTLPPLAANRQRRYRLPATYRLITVSAYCPLLNKALRKCEANFSASTF